MQILTLDGTVFSEIDATKIIEAMRAASRTPSKNIGDFMQQVSGRVSILRPSANQITYISPDRFLTELEAEGFIKII